MKQKIESLLKQLNHGLVEREHTLKAALLTVLAGENLVLIGPPGTGKSLTARRIADCFAGDSKNGGSFVGEGDGGNGFGRHAALNQVGNFVGDDARLARAGTGQHQASAVGVMNSLQLREIEAGGHGGEGR